MINSCILLIFNIINFVNFDLGSLSDIVISYEYCNSVQGCTNISVVGNRLLWIYAKELNECVILKIHS